MESRNDGNSQPKCVIEIKRVAFRERNILACIHAGLPHFVEDPKDFVSSWPYWQCFSNAKGTIARGDPLPSGGGGAKKGYA